MPRVLWPGLVPGDDYVNERANSPEGGRADMQSVETKTAIERCPKCSGRLVLDDTSGIIYCEADPDHFRFSIGPRQWKDK